MQQSWGSLPIGRQGGIIRRNQCECGRKVVPSKAPEEDGEVGLEANHCGIVFVEGVDSKSFSVEEMFAINSDLVPDEEKCWHCEVLSTYPDCISKGRWDLGSAKGEKHTIDPGSAQPIQVVPRRVPFHKSEEVHHQVVKCLKHRL